MSDDCLRKMYVKLRYIPPQKPEIPFDCRNVQFFGRPQIRTLTGQLSALEGGRPDETIGLDLLCTRITTERAGGIILLLQVSSYLEWQIQFLNKQAKYVSETHRIFVSMPMMYKLAGPRIALNAITPWSIKIPMYATQIWNAFRKLSELERTIALALNLRKGLCPNEIKQLELGLKVAEEEFNRFLKSAESEEGKLVQLMNRRPDHTGHFINTRVA